MRVLLIDDEAYDMEWLAELVAAGGHELVVATNREDGRARLEEHARGQRFGLAIVDIMMAIQSLTALRAWDHKVAAESMDSGLVLLEYARRRLAISRQSLPILCYTGRDDVRDRVESLDVELFQRGDPEDEDRLRARLCALLGLPERGPGR